MSIFRDGILSGKVALVTGGGSGIGAGIARTLARQGAAVTLVGRTAEKLEAVAAQIRAAGGRALVAPADVREYAKLEEAVKHTTNELGGLDIVISSAAGNFLAPAAQLSANGFRAVVDIDLCGTFNVCRAAFAALAARKGCVVSITATQAFIPMPLQCHAGAAKAGIEKLTRDLALEWAGSGVRVNSVAPGPIDDTEGMKRLAPGDFGAKSKQQVPLGRWGTIDEVAEAVLYLCSPAAAYVTGCSLLIDGGSSLTGAARFMEMMNG
jgi:NAD(P)-dependent dehydrogenase (short-subunit alcohol dehydrogenase family)